MTYIPLSLGNGFLALFICIMESIIAGIVVTRTALPYEKPISPPDLIRIELGYGLIPLADKDKGEEFIELFRVTRYQLLEELKIMIPKIRIVDNMLLEANEYRILIKEEEAGRWMLKPDCFLCIDSGVVKEELPGEKVCEPVGGLSAIWVSADQREEAERLGYTVAAPITVIVSHLKEIISQRTGEFQKASE